MIWTMGFNVFDLIMVKNYIKYATYLSTHIYSYTYTGWIAL